MIQLSIACIVDHDVITQVKTGKCRSLRAKYDLSVYRTLRKNFRTVALISTYEGDGRYEGGIRTMRECFELQPDVVFNLAYSATDDEASLAGALELSQLPFTGSGAVAIGLANDKVRSRQVLKSCGILVPDFFEVPIGERRIAAGFAPPYLVKPVKSGGSTGIYSDSLVDSSAKALQRARRIWKRFNSPALCDAFITGKEFRVAVLEHDSRTARVVGISESLFRNAYAGTGFKTQAIRNSLRARSRHQVVTRRAQLSRTQARQIADLAQEIMTVLDLRGYFSIDLRLNERNHFVTIEANANPGLWANSQIWKAPSFDANIVHMVRMALSRSR
jgi:D-alanine-D-alanine ligase